MQKAVRKLRVAAAEHGEWTAAASAELYGIRNWGADYFDINEAGEVIVRVPAGGAVATVSLMEIIKGMQQRGLTEAQAMSLAVNGFINDLARQFPMEYSVELKRLIDLEMEGSVG